MATAAAERVTEGTEPAEPGSRVLSHRGQAYGEPGCRFRSFRRRPGRRAPVGNVTEGTEPCGTRFPVRRQSAAHEAVNRELGSVPSVPSVVWPTPASPTRVPRKERNLAEPTSPIRRKCAPHEAVNPEVGSVGSVGSVVWPPGKRRTPCRRKERKERNQLPGSSAMLSRKALDMECGSARFRSFRSSTHDPARGERAYLRPTGP